MFASGRVLQSHRLPLALQYMCATHAPRLIAAESESEKERFGLSFSFLFFLQSSSSSITHFNYTHSHMTARFQGERTYTLIVM